VLIVGAGPVGLACALALARRRVPVAVYERNGALVDDPRAATTHCATLEVLDALGVESEAERQGLVAPIVRYWDRPTGELLAEFDHALLAGDTRFPYVVQCEQFKLTRILAAALATLPDTELHLDAEAVGLAADDGSVTLELAADAGQRRIVRGSHVIGADGGRSFVRKAAGIDFGGFTWPERYLVLTTPWDLERHYGLCYRNYFYDPDEWINCFKVAGDGPPGLWRAVFPVSPEAPEAELLAEDACQARLQNAFPKSGAWPLVHRNLYTVHQRVAATFRKGRVLLAGDAAHVNNSIGGMGLNGGIQDACNLGEKLAEVWHGRSDGRLLDLYDLQRRTVATEFVQRQTIENKRNLEARDPARRAELLDEMRRRAGDPAAARALLLRTSMIELQRRAASLTLADLR
jgi:3-(3-hydroxy-phenyl)propionate hydroxylase